MHSKEPPFMAAKFASVKIVNAKIFVDVIRECLAILKLDAMLVRVPSAHAQKSVPVQKEAALSVVATMFVPTALALTVIVMKELLPVPEGLVW